MNTIIMDKVAMDKVAMDRAVMDIMMNRTVMVTAMNMAVIRLIKAEDAVTHSAATSFLRWRICLSSILRAKRSSAR